MDAPVIRQMAMLGERRVTTVDFALEQLLASVDKHVTSKITWFSSNHFAADSARRVGHDFLRSWAPPLICSALGGALPTAPIRVHSCS